MRIADRPILGIPVRDHIGGRWAISWIAYVINAPINLMGTLSNIVDARSAPIGTWLVIWTLGYGALGLVLLLANVTLFRRRRVTPVPVSWVVTLGALAGGARGLVVGVAADELGVSGGSATLIVTRLITGALMGAILIPAAALLLSVVTSFATRRRELIDSIVELERDRMQAQGESEHLRQLLLADVERRAASASADGEIRSARDLSHELWRDGIATARPPRASIGWRAVLVDTFTNYPYPSLLVAGIWAVSAVGSLTAAIGLGRGLLQVACSVLVIIVAFTLASRLRLADARARLLLLVVTLLVVDVLTGPVASVIFDPRPSGSGTGQVVANSVWIPVLAIIAGIVVSGVRSSEEVLERLTKTVQEEQIAAMAADEERARIQREVAEALHGVQSRVLSARAAGEDTTFSLADILDSPWTKDPQTRLARTLETWGLLMDVQMAELPEELTDTELRDVARIVDEACANAHRHGQARACDIRVSRAKRGLVVEVRDDGNGAPGDARPGLGSGLFDSVSGGTWSRQPIMQGGTLVTVLIPDA